MEVAPPNPQLSGIMVTPLVRQVPAGKPALFSIKYTSNFRNFGPHTMKDLNKVEKDEDKKDEDTEEAKKTPKKEKRRNKKLEDRLKKKKDETDATGGDPKKKGAPAQPPAQPKKDEKKEEKKGKGGAEVDDEEEKRRMEAEEEEKRIREEAESKFNRATELAKIGGKVFEFGVEKNGTNSQHYEWLIPVFFKTADANDTELKTVYLEVRTVTVNRTLVPTVNELDFGEIPVAFRKTNEILIKNTGTTTEILNMEQLTPFGGFSVLNALRPIPPGESRPVVVEFVPFA
jgi:hypothetical protein